MSGRTTATQWQRKRKYVGKEDHRKRAVYFMHGHEYDDHLGGLVGFRVAYDYKGGCEACNSTR